MYDVRLESYIRVIGFVIDLGLCAVTNHLSRTRLKHAKRQCLSRRLVVLPLIGNLGLFCKLVLDNVLQSQSAVDKVGAFRL